MSSKNTYQNDYTNTDVYPQQGYTFTAPTGSYNQYDCSNQQYRNQSSCSNPNMYSDGFENMNWMFDYRFVNDLERGLKFSDKIEPIEISSKDLSPASCCSNFDMLFPESYKNLSHNKSGDKQWYYNTNYNYQKYTEYPSCAQICSENTMNVSNEKYCSIQKTDENSCKNVGYSNDCVMYNKNYADKTYIQDINSVPYQFDKNEYLSQQDCYLSCAQQIPFESLTHLEQQADLSNEGSDIIVEESDDNTDYSEEHNEKQVTTNCIICNVLYGPLGNQFYVLTSESPLTMSTQKPVINRLRELIDLKPSKRYYLCGHCLGLINTIDHLQLKLDNYKGELREKFEKTCQTRKVGELRKLKPWKRLVFGCRKCKKRFSLGKFVANHVKKHRAGFLCEICGKQYLKPSNFKLHQQEHKKREKKLTFPAFVCKICKKPFRTKSHLKEHNNFCSGNLPYKCVRHDCDKKFASLTKMKNHVKLKHDKKFIAICSICNIGFVKASDYKSHMVSHSTDKKYSCSKCEKSYKTLSNLKFHMKVHNKSLPFNCSICQKGFMRKEYLEAHVNVHNGVKNFVCSVCGKKFVAQKNLDSHSKYHDGTVKKRTCNICGKQIATGFEEHLRTHNNLREFECELCEVRCNTKGALAKHKKNKHLRVS